MSRTSVAPTRRSVISRETWPGRIRGESARLRRVEDILESLPADGPGIAVLVMDKDKPVLLKGHGMARIGEQSEKITEDTVFDLASLSKQFTALGVLMLIDQTTRQGPRQGKYDKLSFRTRLSRFFPNIPGANEITIRNLLNHSSGLPDYVVLNEGGEDEFYAFYDGVMLASGDWYATMARKESHLRNEDVIDLLVKNGEPEFEPGTDYAYSNTGYVVLAEIIKKITGKPLSQFLREEVFDHLGMKKTFVFDHEPPEVKDHALCYVKSDDGQVRYRSISGDTIYSCIHGDGNVHSTISDLAKWLKAWNEIDDRRNTRTKLIKRSTFLKIYKPGPFELPNRSPERRRIYNYRSGMFIYRYKNKNVNSYAIHHGGNWLGFNSYLMRGHVYPFRRRRLYELTVVVLSNYLPGPGEGDVPYKIGKLISEVYWQLQGQDIYNVLRYI